MSKKVLTLNAHLSDVITWEGKHDEDKGLVGLVMNIIPADHDVTSQVLVYEDRVPGGITHGHKPYPRLLLKVLYGTDKYPRGHVLINASQEYLNNNPGMHVQSLDSILDDDDEDDYDDYDEDDYDEDDYDEDDYDDDEDYDDDDYDDDEEDE